MATGPSTRRLPTLALLCALFVPMTGAAPTVLAQDAPLVTTRYDPRLQFRTLAVGRFDIHFHQGEEALANRLAALIPETARAVEQRFGTPRGRIHVILVDQSDVSNGWATVVPFNLLELAAVPPPSASMIGNTDDWLRLVFAHEYTHVVHLDKSPGLYGAIRRVFGRVPLAYPNLFLPDWQIEGLATQAESAITGAGRVPAPDFRMLLDEAALADRFAPLDRATSSLIDWPRGNSAYLYGAYFHDYLASRAGEETLRRLADETASRLPFLGSFAYKEVYGASLGELWADFARRTTERARSAEEASERARLTRHGFEVTAPAFAPDGRLFYSVANPHGFPALMELREGQAPHEVATRYFGSQLSIAGDTIVFDQFEIASQIALVSDLYARPLSGGATRRLTQGARAADPDLSPDGRTIVCTVQQSGRRILATLPLPSPGTTGVPVPLVEENEAEFSSPRWSPDGRFITAERRRLAGRSEIVVVDVASREVRTLVSTRDARNMTPAWMPGGDAVLFASDRGGAPFTLYAVDVASGSVRRLRGAGPGAQRPAVTTDGGRVVFVGYSADGYDLYSLPLAGASWEAVAVDENAGAASSPSSGVTVGDAASGARPYSPLATLLPRFWVPYVETDGDDVILGAATAGFDALGRHTYVVSGGWGVPRNRGDLQVDYSYTRWTPALFASVSDDTDSFRDGYVRTREVAAGALFPLRRVRWNASALTSISVSRDDFEREDAQPLRPSRRRTAGRVGASLSNARRYGYSISAEEGSSVNVVAELAAGDAGNGGDGTATTFVAEARHYQAVLPRHAVIAARFGGATSRGDDRVRRDFSASGPGPQGGGFDVGLDAIGLLRGFDDGDVAGRSAVVANLDYRVPLAWPQRGVGTWPAFVSSLHAAAFVDVGHAWDTTFRLEDVRRSIGAELSADVTLGWRLPLTIAGGAAWRVDPPRDRRGFAGFVRIGRAF